MTREQIIKIVNDCVQYNANQGTWSIDNRFADELLTLFEKEKKEVAKEIFEKLAEEGNFTYDYPDEPHCPIVIYNAGILQDLADEYEVEL